MIAHPSVEERRARGKAARRRSRPGAMPGGHRRRTAPIPWPCSRSRTRTREPDLVPVRHGRMMVSPFTFYRGAAKIMAADLKDTPTAGLNVQLCGDAHLSNFGVFASPERTLVFDLNDFDETLPGPFEYDVKRMAASFTIAARNNGFSKADARAATLASVTAYREAMIEFAADAHDGHLVRPPVGTGHHAAAIDTAARLAEGRGKKKMRRTRSEGAGRPPQKARHARQPAGAVEARRARRRSVPDRQPAADRRAAAATWRRRTACPPTRSSRLIHEQFRAYRETLAGRSPAAARAIRGRRRGAQGRRCRERRHAGVHRPAPGTRSAGPVVPAGQGSDAIGAGGSPAEEPVPPTRRAGGAGSADDAGRQRHLPRLDEGRARRTATSTGASCAT